MFRTLTSHGVQTNVYIPDGLVRIGSDYHYLPNGDVLPDLPSLEASACEAGRLHRRELTVVPSQTLASEQLTMHVEEQGALQFEIHVDDSLLLRATCQQ
ncbi:MAG: hypothetical protein KTR31_23235 [Myxococcales bacterium]|nr:hypothetical protein [Myxococcales bacterium]